MQAFREMKEAGLSKTDMALEVLGAVLILAVPVGVMFLGAVTV